MLTKKQSELLYYLCDYTAAHGIAPSFDEMKKALNLQSKSGVHRLITALEERGFIRRLPHRARAIEILKRADQDLFPGLAQSNQKQKFVNVPFHGKIAFSNEQNLLKKKISDLPMPQSLLADDRDYMAFEVAGDSMIEAAIYSGDLVIIEATKKPKDGDIVLALIQNKELMLRKFRDNGNNIVLMPANKVYLSRTYPPSQVKIYGRLCLLIRRNP